jgi:tRNA uridine 5-carbamoylmethylation protein Kti12
MMMPHDLIIMRGLPGSGKSFKAKELANLYGDGNYATVSADNYFLDENGEYHFDRNCLHVAHLTCQRRCEIAMMEKKNAVIVDNTNTTWTEIKPYIELAQKYNYDIDIVEPNTSWQNDIDECFNRNTHGVPLETIEKMATRFQTREHILEQIDRMKNESLSSRNI